MKNPSATDRLVKCPHCGNMTVYAASNKFRPFCSERCRLIDLGDWADGAYRIPVKSQDGYNHMSETDGDSEDSN